MTTPFAMVSTTTGLAALVGTHLFLTFGVAVFGLLVRYDHAKRSTKHRFLGWVIYPLAVGGFFAAGVGELCLTSGTSYSGGLAFVGMLAGILAGYLIGRFIWRYYRKEIEGDEDTR
jgi:hypothetical protein